MVCFMECIRKFNKATRKRVAQFLGFNFQLLSLLLSRYHHSHKPQINGFSVTYKNLTKSAASASGISTKNIPTKANSATLDFKNYFFHLFSRLCPHAKN